MCAQTTRSGDSSSCSDLCVDVSQAPTQAARQTGAPGLWNSPQRRYFKNTIPMQFDVKSPNEPHVRNKQHSQQVSGARVAQTRLKTDPDKRLSV